MARVLFQSPLLFYLLYIEDMSRRRRTNSIGRLRKDRDPTEQNCMNRQKPTRCEAQKTREDRTRCRNCASGKHVNAYNKRWYFTCFWHGQNNGRTQPYFHPSRGMQGRMTKPRIPVRLAKVTAARQRPARPPLRPVTQIKKPSRKPTRQAAEFIVP